jgi:hypothetical protein
MVYKVANDQISVLAGRRLADIPYCDPLLFWKTAPFSISGVKNVSKFGIRMDPIEPDSPQLLWPQLVGWCPTHIRSTAHIRSKIRRSDQ